MTDTAAGETRSVEDLVGRVADEFIDRLDRGERPDVEEYARKYPAFAAVLRDVLGALELMRAAGPAAEAPPVPADRSGCLGDFRIVREVGRGGMGVVYEAEQISLRRRVALKVLPFAAALDGRQIQRFRNEAQAAAHLHHTNIVPVYGVGCDRGVHYYAMQFIDGQTLAAFIAGLRPDPGPVAPPDPATATPRAAGGTTVRSAADPEFFRTVARLGAQAADALEHAHALGVVHRDVKPANLLVDGRGHLWVTDFGLARLQNDAGLTLSGDLLGTLRYMSPEQALAKHDLVDHRTDVYSLGASLYELLTQEPPFRADGRAALLRAIAEDEPTPPRRRNRAVPAELGTVVLKALAKSPAERYATTAELADDLRRFLDDKPVRARRPTAGQRLRRWARRHRAAARAAAGAAAVAVATVLLGLTLSNLAITAERDRAQQAEADRTRQLYDALVARARADRLSGRLGGRADALAVLEEAAGLAAGRGPDEVLRLRNEVISALTTPGFRVEREWDGHPVGTRAVAIDPFLRRYARCEPDGTVTVRRVADDGEDARLAEAVAGPGVTFLRFDPGGERLAVWVHGAATTSAAIWDLTTGRVCRPLPEATWVDFCPTGRRVAVREACGPVRVVELDGGREVARFTPGVPGGYGQGFVFDPGGRMLAVRTAGGREVEVWHLASPDRPWRATTPGPIGGIAWNPAGTELAVGSGDDVLLWKLGQATPRATLTGHFSRVNGLAYSPDGGTLASSGYDAIVRFWDPRSGRPLASAPGVLGPWFDRGGGRVAFANGSRLVVVRADPPDGVRTLHRDGAAGIGAVDVSPDGRLVAASGSDGVTAWDLGTGGRVAHLPVGHAAAAAFDPTGASLLTFGRSPGRWPVARGETLRLGPPDRLPGPGGFPVDPSPSADGRTVVAGVGAEVLVLDAPALSVRRRLAAPLNHWRPAVSPDGRWVAVGCWHGTEVRVWDAATGRPVYHRHFPTTSGCRVGFSPDGRWLVEGTGDGYRAVETGTWRPAWSVPRANAGDLPGVLAFSRDGRLLAVAHSPVLVKLYRPGTAEEVATLPSPDPHLLGGLCFSPDGGRLVASTEGDRLFAWDLRALRAGLTRFGLDWDLPPLPPTDDPRPVRVEVEPGDLHPARREAAECRRALAAKPDDPGACNNLAWHLATGPDDLRDPAAALPLAEAAVRLDPTHARLNTLGVVLYRLGRWQDAVAALNRSIGANGGEVTAYDAFFRAMCYHRLGEPEKARREYARAVRWMDLHRPDDGDELPRFRAEAEALIGR